MAHSTQIFQRPRQLISFAENGRKLQVDEDVLQELRRVPDQLIVVTITGRCYTGKSWLMNRLANCSPRVGFAVSKGQSIVTKGIWIFCKKHPNRENCTIVFMDTEGLENPFKHYTASEDYKLFTVAFQLSSILIYNVSRQLCYTDLQTLSFVTRLVEELQGSETRRPFQEFVLVIRDVTEIILDGRAVPPNEYLQRVLSSNQANLLNNFERKKGFPLTQPVEFPSLDLLGQLDNPPLLQEYLEQEKDLTDHIYRADFKRLENGSPCTSRVFCDMIREMVRAFENSSILGIPLLSLRRDFEVSKVVPHKFPNW